MQGLHKIHLTAWFPCQVTQVSSGWRRNDWEVDERPVSSVGAGMGQPLQSRPMQEQAELPEASYPRNQQREMALHAPGLGTFLPKGVVDRSLHGFKESSWKRNPLRVTKYIETISGSGSS